MVINARTFNSLRCFKHLSCLPIFIACILFHLISTSVIYKTDFFSSDFQNMSFFIKLLLLEDFWKSKSHRLDSILCLQFCFNKLLVDNISFAILDDKQDPCIQNFSLVFILNTLFVNLNGVFKVRNHFIWKSFHFLLPELNWCFYIWILDLWWI